MKIHIETLHNLDEAYSLWRISSIKVDDIKSFREFGYIKYYEIEPENFIGAYTENILVGIVVCFFDGRKASLYRLAVNEKYRNKGIAAALISYAEEKIIDAGYNSVFCLIEEENIISMSLFKKFDYHEFPNIKYFIKQL